MNAATISLEPATEAPVAPAAEDLDARRELAFEANYEITSLVDAAKKLLAEERSEDTIKYTAILSRIALLSEIIFHAVRLDGTDGDGWGDWDDLKKLKRAFEGQMA